MGKHIVLPKARFTSEDIHRAIFVEPPEARTLNELKHAVARYARQKYARN